MSAVKPIAAAPKAGSIRPLLFSPSDLSCIFGVVACSLIGFAPVIKYYFQGAPPLFFFLGIVACVTLAMVWLRARHLTAAKRLSAYWLLLPWCVFTLLFAVLYPLAHRYAFGAGSDRGDALRLAASALLHGHYPYYATTFLGNPITPLPGAVLLALPFLLFQIVSLQNIFWLAAFLWFAQWFFRSRSTALIYVFVLLGASAANLDDFTVGGDYIVNAMYVCVAMGLVLAAHRRNLLWPQIAADILLGIAIDSRPIYIVVLPLLLAFLWQRHDRVIALRAVLISATTAALLFFPFYLYDPAHFAPLHVRDKLDFLPAALHAAWLLPALGLLVSSAGFFIRLSRPRLFLLTGLALFPMLGIPGLWGWILFFPHVPAWFQLSVATPVALFVSLWFFSRYEQSGYDLRSRRSRSSHRPHAR